MGKLFMQAEHVNDLIGRVDDYFTQPKQKPKSITNADRIRSMTDEELAGWINCRISICVPGKKPGRDCPIGMCEECWLEWLKQEVTENERH